MIVFLKLYALFSGCESGNRTDGNLHTARSLNCGLRRTVFAPRRSCAIRARALNHAVVAASSQVSDLHTKWGKSSLRSVDHNSHQRHTLLHSKQAQTLVSAGIDGHVEFGEGKGGQTMARLKHACGSTAEVCAGRQCLHCISNLPQSCSLAAHVMMVSVGVLIWSQCGIMEAA